MMARDVIRHEILSMLDEFSRRLALSSDSAIRKLGPSIKVAVVDKREALHLFREWSHCFRRYLEENERYVVELLAG
jgi:hypothetical protein